VQAALMGTFMNDSDRFSVIQAFLNQQISEQVRTDLLLAHLRSLTPPQERWLGRERSEWLDLLWYRDNAPEFS